MGKAANKSICVMLPNIGGGTYRHGLEMSLAWSQECPVIFVEFSGRFFLVSIIVHRKKVWTKGWYQAGYPRLLAELLVECNVQIIHIHHFLFMSDELMTLLKNISIPYAVTLHDYYTVCPRVNLLRNGVYCGIPDDVICNECITAKDNLKEGIYPQNITNIKNWRFFWQEFLERAYKVVCPSEDQRLRLTRLFPMLTNKICVIENPELISPELKKDRTSKLNDGVLSVGLIGTLEKHKGRDILIECARLAVAENKNIRFVLFGVLHNVTNNIPKNLTVLGKYRDDDIYDIIAENPVDFFWFPAIIPETYSYVLTIPIRMSIPVIGTDIGAISERIRRQGWGEVYSPQCTTREILDVLLNFNPDVFLSMGDFTIYNNAFPTVNEYYGMLLSSHSSEIEKEMLTKVNKIIVHKDENIHYYDKINDLKWYEFKKMWLCSSNIIEKLRLLLSLEKTKLIRYIQRRLMKIIFMKD